MAHDALHAFMNGESVDEFMSEIIPVPDQLYCTHILRPKNFSKAKAIQLSQKRLENNPEMTLNTVFEGPPDDEFYRFENEFIISKTKLRFYQVDMGAHPAVGSGQVIPLFELGHFWGSNATFLFQLVVYKCI